MQQCWCCWCSSVGAVVVGFGVDLVVVGVAICRCFYFVSDGFDIDCCRHLVFVLLLMLSV